MSKKYKIKYVGQTAYELYFDFSEGKSLVSGAPLPKWKDQSEKIKEAWAAVEVGLEKLFTDKI